MKRFWEEEELAEHFTVTASDWELIGQKPDASRLGFTILLKCLQYEGAFPKHRADVPLPVVRFVAAQLGVDGAHFGHDHFKGRTAERHRNQIRAALGYRPSTEQDLKEISAWLVAYLQPEDHYTDTAKFAALEHLHELRIEPPSHKQLRRALKSACYTAEEQLANRIADRLPKDVRIALDDLLRTSSSREDKDPVEETGEDDADAAPESEERRASLLFTLKRDPGRASLKSILREVERLQIIRDLRLPAMLFPDVHQKVLQALRQRVFTEEPFELRRHPDALRSCMLAAFCWLRGQEITDNLIEQLNQIVYKIGAKAEKKADDELMSAVKRVRGKTTILRKIAQESIKRPHDDVDEVVYPAAGGKHVLEDIANELEAISGYDDHVHLSMRSSYAGHYRRMVPPILRMLTFRSNNDAYRPVIRAIDLLQRYADISGDYSSFAEDETIPLTDVVPERWMPLVQTENGRINRIAYEICALQALRDKLRCKEIWVEGALRYRNYVEYQVLSSLRSWHVYTPVGALFFRERKLPPHPRKRKTGCGGRTPEPPPSPAPQPTHLLSSLLGSRHANVVDQH